MIDKLSPSAAANAYSAMQKTATGTADETGESGKGDATGSGGGMSFGAMLKNLTASSIDSLHQGEKASAAAITGKADLTDVVQSITNAESTLDTVVAVRDRMLSAYDKIMQMPI